MEFILAWLILSGMVGVLAHNFGRSGTGWLFIALLLSPFFAGCAVLIIGRKTAEVPPPQPAAAPRASAPKTRPVGQAERREPTISGPPVAAYQPPEKPLRAMHKRPKIPGFEPAIGDGQGEETLDIEPIYGLVAGIEYQDANGEISRRRISFSEISDAGVIDAYCFERKAPRRFRIDRLRKFFDLNGHEFTPAEYFAMMKTADARLEITEKMRPPVWQSHWRDILVLSVMARADGVMEDSETATILAALTAVLDSESVTMGPAEERALIARIRRVKAEPEMALRAAKGLSKKPMALRLRLIAAAQSVMDADGVRDADEQRYFAALRHHLDVV